MKKLPFLVFYKLLVLLVGAVPDYHLKHTMNKWYTENAYIRWHIGFLSYCYMYHGWVQQTMIFHASPCFVVSCHVVHMQGTVTYMYVHIECSIIKNCRKTNEAIAQTNDGVLMSSLLTCTFCLKLIPSKLEFSSLTD